MQKFSACRNRGSSIHFFSSTITRCIMAIWPAGPPKLTQPILSQSQKNSANDGRRATCCSVVMSRGFGWSVVALLRGKAQVGEQCIVDHEALLQQASSQAR